MRRNPTHPPEKSYCPAFFRLRKSDPQFHRSPFLNRLGYKQFHALNRDIAGNTLELGLPAKAP